MFDKILSEETRQVIWEWVESLAIALVFAFFIQAYCFQPFQIPSGSMRMTLIEGDRLFVNKFAYGASWAPLEARVAWWKLADSKNFDLWKRATQHRFPGLTKPRRGDVIVFRYPVTQDKDFIKRLIAFGGETVEIKDGRVLVNDVPVDEGQIGKVHYYNYGDHAKPGQKITVPKGQYFVMGDNSASSHDGRYWGFVPEEFVIGKADMIFWPLNRITSERLCVGANLVFAHKILGRHKVGPCAIVLCFIFLAGCASLPHSSVKQPEPAAEQIRAAKKVVDAMAPASGVVEKYSPVTGRHYSGALEFEPGTGVKLIPVEE
jgi:signal peptidase I